MKKIGELSIAHQIMANRRMVSYGLASVKKPYPKRIQLAEKVFKIIRQEIRAEVFHRGGEATTPASSIRIAGKATQLIVKVVQNNYRRRRKSA